MSLFGNKSKKKTQHQSRIGDNFSTYEQLQEALKKEGLESSNLVVAIDFTKSNEGQGRRTFQGRSLHAIDSDIVNPYQKVIQIIGKALSAFDEDGLIPCYGFGDWVSRDSSVFSLRQRALQSSGAPSVTSNDQNDYCFGFQEVLQVYEKVAQHVVLSGPTNFAPCIYRTIDICRESGRAQFHILVIIADGQVTNEIETVKAIVDASSWPISIICIGVGDGPFDLMEEFDDQLPQRRFDNFQFIYYNSVIEEALKKGRNPEQYFALHALMEVPEQYRIMKKLGLVGKLSH